MNAKQISIYLLILFLVFLIVTDASQAGDFGRQFFDWIGTGLGRFLDFLDSLFETDGDNEPGTALGLW
ncbi:MAG: hypothetical protein AAFZ07_01055 [Actinomycetota bacterium]